MSHTYTLTVTVTPPGGAPVVLNTTDPATAETGAVLSAVDALAVSWGASSGRDHPDPGSIALRIRHAAPDAIAYESLIEAQLQVDGRPAVLVARGWASVLTQHQRRRLDGTTLWLTDVQAVDVLGLAAAVRLASLPWPAEGLTSRLPRINTASPVPLVATMPADARDAPSPSAALRSRDVDNADALEIIRITASSGAPVTIGTERAWLPGFAHEGPAGVTVDGLAGITLAWLPVQFVPVRHRPPVTLPAAAVERTAATTSRASVLDQVGVSLTPRLTDAAGVRDLDPADAIVRPAVRRQRSTSAHTITTDHWAGVATEEETLTVDDIPAPNRRWALALIAEAATPVPIPDAATIDLELLPAATVELLTGIGSRGNVVTAIDPPTPPVDQYQRVLGGRLTYRHGRPALVVDTEPAQLAGARPMRWSDWPKAGYGPLDPPRFSDLRTPPAGIAPLTAAETRCMNMPALDYLE